MKAANTKATYSLVSLSRKRFLNKMLVPISTIPKIGKPKKHVPIKTENVPSNFSVSASVSEHVGGGCGTMGFAKAAGEGRIPKRNCSQKISRSFFMPSNKGDLDFTAKNSEYVY